MSEHPGVLYLIPEKAVVCRASQGRNQLLETGSDPAQRVLGTLTLTLLPCCRQLVHGTTPPTHDLLQETGDVPVTSEAPQTSPLTTPSQDEHLLKLFFKFRNEVPSLKLICKLKLNCREPFRKDHTE